MTAARITYMNNMAVTCFFREPSDGAMSRVRRLLLEYGRDLAEKTYLYGEPFGRPRSFGPAHTVRDPSFDARPTLALVAEFGWMRERTLQVCGSLRGRGRPLVAASSYLTLLEAVDPYGH